MKIPKAKAIELIDEKIKKFKDLLKNATHENSYNEDYQFLYNTTEGILAELFSEKEAQNFRKEVSIPLMTIMTGKPNPKDEFDRYYAHINSCITQLKVYRERIQNFWTTEEIRDATKRTIVPFVSMSFDEADKEINEYVTGILEALQIDFETGERYSKDSIPEKVKSRIRNSDLLISIFVKRAKKEGGGYTTPSWLLKELGIAQGASKDVIPLVEKDIDPKELAGLNWEKEVIYFVRENVKEIEKATIKFIEALKEHKLI